MIYASQARRGNHLRRTPLRHDRDLRDTIAAPGYGVQNVFALAHHREEQDRVA